MIPAQPAGKLLSVFLPMLQRKLTTQHTETLGGPMLTASSLKANLLPLDVQLKREFLVVEMSV
jgi:hypothetical protein